MSTGPFTTVNYPADYGAGTAIHPIRVQPETLALSLTIGGSAVTNTASVSPATNPISAQISRGRRTLGLNARLIRLRVTAAGTSPFAVGALLTVPILNKALSAATSTTTGTYIGATVRVVGISGERVR